MEDLSSPLQILSLEDEKRVVDIANVDMYTALSDIFYSDTIFIEKDDAIKIFKNENKRYFGDSTICYECGQTGHLSKDCAIKIERNCAYCSLYHLHRPCAFIFCYNCCSIGHKEKHCKIKKNNKLMCTRCPLQFHLTRDCPRLWRKYIVRNLHGEKSLKTSCAFCFSGTHFIDDCPMKDCKISIFSKNYKKLAKYIYKN
ncbi:hypothetical protein ENBRE01_0005 [Enteropsectra breve]|nr:hypothetical protein ENBRE01_0005 [Enteropsectra breve]